MRFKKSKIYTYSRSEAVLIDFLDIFEYDKLKLGGYNFICPLCCDKKKHEDCITVYDDYYAPVGGYKEFKLFLDKYGEQHGDNSSDTKSKDGDKDL